MLDRAEVMSAAYIGLMDAAQKYDPNKKNEAGESIKFRTYADVRVRGEVLDYMRDQDTLTRGERKKLKDYEKIKDELSKKLGRQPTDEEIARSGSLTIEHIRQIHEAGFASSHISLDQGNGKKGGGLDDTLSALELYNPEENAIKSERATIIRDVLETLKPKLRTVYELYFFEDLTMAEVAREIGITESGVSHMIKKSKEKVRQALISRGIDA